MGDNRIGFVISLGGPFGPIPEGFWGGPFGPIPRACCALTLVCASACSDDGREQMSGSADDGIASQSTGGTAEDGIADVDDGVKLDFPSGEAGTAGGDEAG